MYVVSVLYNEPKYVCHTLEKAEELKLIIASDIERANQVRENWLECYNEGLATYLMDQSDFPKTPKFVSIKTKDGERVIFSYDYPTKKANNLRNEYTKKFITENGNKPLNNKNIKGSIKESPYHFNYGDVTNNTVYVVHDEYGKYYGIYATKEDADRYVDYTNNKNQDDVRLIMDYNELMETEGQIYLREKLGDDFDSKPSSVVEPIVQEFRKKFKTEHGTAPSSYEVFHFSMRKTTVVIYIPE